MKNTEKALNDVLNAIAEIRKDVRNGYNETADMQLSYLETQVASIKREQLPLDCMDAKAEGPDFSASGEASDLRESIEDARTTIGTFFEDLREIYEPKEGNLKP